MKRIVFVTPADARNGFALTGVRQVVTGSVELAATLTSLESDPSIGVLAIDERLVDEPARERIAADCRHWAGVIVVVPSPRRPAAIEEDYTSRMIRSAIGYQVRVNR